LSAHWNLWYCTTCLCARMLSALYYAQLHYKIMNYLYMPSMGLLSESLTRARGAYALLCWVVHAC
jgi:hypothetical protein